MSLLRRGKVWWYEFWFAGRRIQESSKSTSKTIAKQAEQKRRRELEEGFNGLEDGRAEQIRTIRELAKEYLARYALRNRGVVFAEYALRHVNAHIGDKMVVDVDADTIRDYQDARLKEGAAPKTVNEEVGFLLRVLGERGDIVRARLKKQHSLKLKVRTTIAKAFTPEEKQRLMDAAQQAKSPLIYPVVMLALNAGMRNGEIRELRWAQIDMERRFLVVGRSKTEAGEGRTIPLNPALYDALKQHAEWFQLHFGSIDPNWCLFPYGKANHLDPTRPITTLKTAWTNVRDRAGVKGRMHDSRHTLITELAESGAGDQTIMDIAGHVSKQMLKHYSHIRMEAKRKALDQVWKNQTAAMEAAAQKQKTEQNCSPESGADRQVEGESLQKSLQAVKSKGWKHRGGERKPLKRIGSSGRTRTYNPSVNSRTGCSRLALQTQLLTRA
jgi:integrase